MKYSSKIAKTQANQLQSIHIVHFQKISLWLNSLIDLPRILCSKKMKKYEGFILVKISYFSLVFLSLFHFIAVGMFIFRKTLADANHLYCRVVSKALLICQLCFYWKFLLAWNKINLLAMLITKPKEQQEEITASSKPYLVVHAW